MMYIGGDIAIIQGKFHHVGMSPTDVTLPELSFKKDFYQYDLNSCMMIMSIPLTWHKRDLNTTYMMTHENPINITINGSQTKHDES